jgi:hypothetical protein
MMIKRSRRSCRDEVVDLMRQQSDGVFSGIARGDVHWETWRWLYEQGLSPSAAVARAFLTEQ